MKKSEQSNLPLQKDPVLIRLETNSSGIRQIYPILTGLAGFILIIFVIALLTHVHFNEYSAFEFIMWIFVVHINTYNYYKQTVALRFWKRKLPQRPYALEHQNQLRADRQPHAVPAGNTISEISCQMKKNSILLESLPLSIPIALYSALIVIFLVQTFFSTWNTTTIAITSIVVITIIAILLYVILRAKIQNRIIVAPNGIASIQNNIQDTIDWQDARLFSTYIGPRSFIESRSFFNRTPVRYYELAGNNTIVRWQWHNRTFDRFTFMPALNKQEYDAWMQQILNQVVTYTGLPLVDLDKLDKNDVLLHRD